MTLPKQTKAWISKSTNGGLDAFEQRTVDLPELGPNDVLVKVHAATLNYRDIMLTVGTYVFPTNSPVIPLSDGAGEIIATGPNVKLFKVGDKVASLFNQGHQHGSITTEAAGTGLGGALDGLATQYAVFPETGVVRAPKGYSYEEAASLPCAAVTAWNGLYGLRPLKAGESVLIQGTGGVSLFALQFAKAAGAFVIATTSSEEKEKLLRELGADVVINYKTTPEWGPVAKKASPGGVGVDHVIEIGGTGTIGQAYKAIKPEGIISLIGAGGVAKGGDEKDFHYMNALANICILRGVFVGSKEQHEEMNRAIEANGIKPVLDKTVFKFDELKDALQYQMDAKHVGKIVVKISE